jgi:hypothetical protein
LLIETGRGGWAVAPVVDPLLVCWASVWAEAEQERSLGLEAEFDGSLIGWELSLMKLSLIEV